MRRRILVLLAFVLIIIFFVFAFVYILSLGIIEGVSVEGQCKNVVNDKKNAAICFNQFFSDLLAKYPNANAYGTYENVSEEDIFLSKTEYHINKSGYGSPYYIDKDGRIMLEHG